MANRFKRGQDSLICYSGPEDVAVRRGMWFICESGRHAFADSLGEPFTTDNPSIHERRKLNLPRRLPACRFELAVRLGRPTGRVCPRLEKFIIPNPRQSFRSVEIAAATAPRPVGGLIDKRRYGIQVVMSSDCPKILFASHPESATARRVSKARASWLRSCWTI